MHSFILLVWFLGNGACALPGGDDGEHRGGRREFVGGFQVARRRVDGRPCPGRGALFVGPKERPCRCDLAGGGPQPLE